MKHENKVSNFVVRRAYLWPEENHICCRFKKI